MSKWYYKETERDYDHVLYTVMIETENGIETDSDHNKKEDAAQRCAYLNGDHFEQLIIGKLNTLHNELIRIENKLTRMICAESDMASCLDNLTHKETGNDNQQKG